MLPQLKQIETFRVQRIQNELLLAIEENNFFSIAYFKDQERIRKKSYFGENGYRKTVVVVNPSNYANVTSEINGEEIITLPEQALSSNVGNPKALRESLEGTIVIMTNNNVAKIGSTKLAQIIEATPNTLYLIHDFDNHHWYEHSMQCALLADIYAPAHLSDNAFAARINPNVVVGIPCGTIQWKKSFLLEHIQELVTNQRKREPLGIHSFYGKFRFRNSVIATVNKHYESVALLKQDFHGRTAHDRWEEWIAYPVHWIAPVFNDLPLRFFDSLITGGIPLVPNSLIPYLTFLEIPERFYIPYTPADLLEVPKFVRGSIEQFERQGEEGRLDRHIFAKEHFHVDTIILKLLTAAKNAYLS
jgi:hypothetical protein